MRFFWTIAVFNYLGDLIFCLDMTLYFWTPYTRDGMYERNLPEVSRTLESPAGDDPAVALKDVVSRSYGLVAGNGARCSLLFISCFSYILVLPAGGCASRSVATI
jgi:hypothetical protein